MICTTLNKIRENEPCLDGWRKLLAGLNKTGPDDELLPLVTILKINGLNDALWALRATDCDRESRLLAVAYARQVQHLMTDARSVAALDVAERFANGKATRKELKKSHTDALAAVWDAREAAADDAGDDWILAAGDTWIAKWDAARAAARATEDDATWAAADDAGSAARAAAAAWIVVRHNMLQKQIEPFKEILG